MKHLLLAVLLALPWTVGHAEEFDHAAWDALLKQHVTTLRNGQAAEVDYAGFSADRARLKHYLASLSAVTPVQFERWDRASQLAFLINAYNAYTVELILTGYPDVKSIKDLGSLLRSPWKKRFIPLLGETRSLDDIEQGLIRGSGRYKEPRIHFAVNCASIGCPALRPEAYVGERLDAQLEEATSSFLEDRTRNRLEGNRLKVSSIFKWYKSDFENGWRGSESLAGFLAHYRKALGLDENTANQVREGKIAIDFLDYDWRLNAKGGGKP